MKIPNIHRNETEIGKCNVHMRKYLQLDIVHYRQATEKDGRDRDDDDDDDYAKRSRK